MIAANVSTSRRLEWVFAPRLLPFWYAGIAAGWWQAFAAEARLEVARGALSATTAEWLPAPLVAGKFVAFGIEAAFFRLLWAALGRNLDFWRYLCVIASASMADLLAQALAARAEAEPTIAIWVWPLAGLRLWSDGPFDRDAWRAAFGGFGLFAAARIAVCALGQARSVAVPFAQALGVTAGAWLASRLLIFWTVDLLRGMSPLGG